MFWIAFAAAQISAPVPLNKKSLFSADDFPRSVASRFGTGFWQVGVQLTVRPDGSLQSCDIDRTSGVAELDRRSCDIIHQRAKFAPASLNGKQVYGIYRTTIGWALADAPVQVPRVDNPELDLSVQSLPPPLQPPVVVRVMFAVDAAGQLSSCTAEPGLSLEHANNVPALVSIACEQLVATFKPAPPRDAQGTPVASVQDAVIRFSTQ
jgi:hypothetical protein